MTNLKDKVAYVKEKIFNCGDELMAEDALDSAINNGWFAADSKQTDECAQLIKTIYGSLPKLAAKAGAVGERKMIKLIGLSKLPSKEYVCQRFELSKGSFGLLCATGSSGKTMFIQYLACCISSGKPLFNQYEVAQGSIVHIDMEQSELQTQRRYERLAAGMNLTDLDVERVVLQTRFDSKLLELSAVEAELTDLLKGKTIALIDSLKAVSEVDENSADIEIVLKLFKRVAEKTGCAILLVHHKGKGKDAKQSGRGHSSIYDSVDVQIDLNQANGIFELVCAKNRDGAYFDGLTYQLIDDGAFDKEQNCTEMLRFSLLQGDVKAPKTEMRTRILEILAKDGEHKLTDLYEKVKGDRNKFGEILDALTSSEEIEEKRLARGAKQFTITAKGKVAIDWSL